MKQLKRLLSLGMTMVLAFCVLSTGMLVHAEEVQTGPFASLQVDGQSIDTNKNPEMYTVLNYDKTKAKITWTLNDGWSVYNAFYYDSDSYESVDIESGAAVGVPKGNYAQIYFNAQNGSEYASYILYICNGKVKAINDKVWVGEKTMPLFEGLHNNLDVVSIKSSKPGVVAARKGEKIYDCSLTGKKAGSSKIEVVLKINGENKKFTSTVTVKKYPNALTSLKVNGKSVNLKKNKFMAMQKVSKDKTKLEYKVAKGWKVKSCSYYNEEKDKLVNVKSGGTVTTKNGAWVVFTLTKGSDVFFYDLSLER